MSNTGTKQITHVIEHESIHGMTLMDAAKWLVTLAERTNWLATIKSEEGYGRFYITWTAPETGDEYLTNEAAKYRQEAAAKAKRKEMYEELSKEFNNGSDWK